MDKSLKLKGNGGITLIALVITIIVLIILAGISIAMISGQDGIISKAGAGAAANQLGAAKDKCALLATEATQDVYQTVYVNSTGVAGDINKNIDDATCTKINAAKDEIQKLLGNTSDGLTVTHTSGQVGGTILLKYSDGTFVKGTLNSGKITWNPINDNT